MHFGKRGGVEASENIKLEENIQGGSGKLNLRENQRITGANLCEIERICGRLSASAQVFLN